MHGWKVECKFASSGHASRCGCGVVGATYEADYCVKKGYSCSGGAAVESTTGVPCVLFNNTIVVPRPIFWRHFPRCVQLDVFVHFKTCLTSSGSITPSSLTAQALADFIDAIPSPRGPVMPLASMLSLYIHFFGKLVYGPLSSAAAAKSESLHGFVEHRHERAQPKEHHQVKFLDGQVVVYKHSRNSGAASHSNFIVLISNMQQERRRHGTYTSSRRCRAWPSPVIARQLRRRVRLQFKLHDAQPDYW